MNTDSMSTTWLTNYMLKEETVRTCTYTHLRSYQGIISNVEDYYNSVILLVFIPLNAKSLNV